MKLPNPAPVLDVALAAIVERHRLGSASLAALPAAGIINTVYALGDDLVLRVPRNHPAHTSPTRIARRPPFPKRSRRECARRLSLSSTMPVISSRSPT